MRGLENPSREQEIGISHKIFLIIREALIVLCIEHFAAGLECNLHIAGADRTSEAVGQLKPSPRHHEAVVAGGLPLPCNRVDGFDAAARSRAWSRTKHSTRSQT